MKQTHYVILAVALMVIGLVWVVLAWTDVISFPFADWIGWIIIAVGGFLGQIYSNMESKNVGLFKLLVFVAIADGNLSDEEAQQIGEYAKQFDIKGKRLEAIIKQVTTGKVEFPIPETTEEKKENIKALVKIAGADGKIAENELILIKTVASRYGLSENFVNELI